MKKLYFGHHKVICKLSVLIKMYCKYFFFKALNELDGSVDIESIYSSIKCISPHCLSSIH